MNIKEKIGKRILNARKAAGLTVKELAERTKSLRPTRITNWEQGTRTPGPNEILQLAAVLNVEPAYLLCLSEINSPQDYFKQKIIPLLPLEEAHRYKQFFKKELLENIQQFDHVLIDRRTSQKCFASSIDDKSMSPEFDIGDIVIIDAEASPSPGKYVLAKLKTEPKAMLRKYRDLRGAARPASAYELVPLNTDWPALTIKAAKDCEILGVMIEQRRYSR